MAILTPYWGLDGIILFLSFWVVAYLYMTRKFKYWQKRGIMEVAPAPFFGNFLDCFLLRKPAANFVKDLYEQSKGLPYMGFYVFDKPFILIRDPELVKHVLVKDFNVFADRYASPDVNDRLGYANLFMMKNPGWKVLRTKLTPIFTSGKLKKMFELMIEVGYDLDQYLESLSLEGKGKNIDAKEVCAKFTTDLIATTAFGLRANSMNDPNADFRKYGKKVFEYSVSRGFEFLTIFFIPGVVRSVGSKFFGKEVSDFFRSIFWQVINERMASGVKRNDLIDLLIELKKTYNDEDLGGFKFTGDDLVAQAAVFFTGGFETSSTVMSFGLYELALQPDIQKKLRQTIIEGLEKTNGKVTYDLVACDLPYLDMVVHETLRMYPPLGFLDRIAGQDYKVPNSDLVIEKGTPVIISMTGMHYDPQYFPNPEKFDPERFTEENKKNRPSYVYFPFGEGPHVCIGLRLGLLQTKLGLIHLLRQYEFSPSEKTTIPMRLDPKGLTTTAVNGIQLNVRKIVSTAA